VVLADAAAAAVFTVVPEPVQRLRQQWNLRTPAGVRSQCKDCGGSGLCEHQRVRSKCEDCGGSGLGEHQRVRSKCRDCGGSSLCEHKRESQEAPQGPCAL